MKGYFSSFCILISICLFNSCDYIHNRQIVRQFQNMVMDFSGDYLNMTTDSVFYDDPLSGLGPVTLVSYLDEKLCTPCLANYLSQALKFTYIINSDSLKYVCIAYPREQSSLREAVKDLDPKEITVYYDVNNVFFKNNSLDLLRKEVPKTFLIDRTGKILLIGDPMTSKSFFELYKNNIPKIIDKLETN